ncbi:phage portal protein [Brevundimonas sp.]|uniref:phage portal protein n=1 Tax=Brevundimonas sp. TaxID=1871086 RepID=UPI002897EEC1|nr:phage portal protein [Brevundimonas sp.]
MAGVFAGVGRPYPSPRASAEGLGLDRKHEGAGRRGAFMANWRPSLRSADADWLDDRDSVVARSRDVGRNEGVGASASMRTVNSAVGFRWDFTSKPNWIALGLSYEVARQLGQQIGAAWEQYAYGIHFQADAERVLTFGGLLRLTAAHIFNDGEMLGVVEWAEDEGTRYSTRLRVIDPDRLSNPNGVADGWRLENGNTVIGGVEKNAAQVPVAYWIRESHPGDIGSTAKRTWRRLTRYSTNLGRPQVLHAFDKLRASQTRGVTRFASVLKLFKAFSTFTDKTLEAAALNALFLGFIKSNAGPSAVSESFDADDLAGWSADREDFYHENPIQVMGAQMPVLGPDDDVQMQTTARDTSGFDGFTRSILRLIAAALGVTYEELSMDFSTTNYSSARAALMIAWKETMALRGLIEQQVAWLFFAAWLEEAIDIGAVVLPEGAPDFYDAIDAYVEGRWRGPGRGHIDPTKEIAAAAARIEAGVSTLEDECAEYDGSDWEEKLEQQARETAKKRDLGPLASSSPEFTDDPEADRQRDARPRALARVTALADSYEHNAFLDARPAA